MEERSIQRSVVIFPVGFAILALGLKGWALKLVSLRLFAMGVMLLSV